ncbi:imelysin family protein [Neomegalonema sp.]|uniref:imelysin family protein n=1 Tax=Neomegalonema sp. TaxID=2039713 RepID=UPI002616E6C2|nr:imelysin family protein [Neomegalonema sp.]MDD2869993.1 imelysin family protein [Neomegalonema sp.]
MRHILAFLLLAGLPAPAFADVGAAVDRRILPAYEGFATAAEALAAEAGTTCDPEALRPPFNAAWDAWMQASHLHLGPSEEKGRALAILFWPDPKGLGGRAQRALLTGDPAALEPEAFAGQSVAARGLAGLERLLYPSSPPEADACPLIRATTQDLARLAQELVAGWEGPEGFAQNLLTAGEPGNTRYLAPGEAVQALFTQLVAGIEFQADQRLGRPLGTKDRPRPERAEARASERSLRNLTLALKALREMAVTLDGTAARTASAFDRAIEAAEALEDPTFAGVASAEERPKIEELQRLIRQIRRTALDEMPPTLGVTAGFNSQDGD